MIRILKSELGSPTKFRNKLMENGFLGFLKEQIKKERIDFGIEGYARPRSPVCKCPTKFSLKGRGRRLLRNEHSVRVHQQNHSG